MPTQSGCQEPGPTELGLPRRYTHTGVHPQSTFGAKHMINKLIRWNSVWRRRAAADAASDVCISACSRLRRTAMSETTGDTNRVRDGPFANRHSRTLARQETNALTSRALRRSVHEPLTNLCSRTIAFPSKVSFGQSLGLTPIYPPIHLNRTSIHICQC